MADETILGLFETLAIDTSTLVAHPNSTIKPPPGINGDDARAAMEAFVVSLSGASAIESGDTIGQGGMGVVRLAEQTSLGRTVALKTLRPDHVTEQNALQVLREGWVTGRLEHPNIVPVHDAGLDASGNPFLLLKRIEGEHWGVLMHDRAALRERFGADDPLEWNLRVLLSVCNAVRFAHDRGVIHRDLKPENVMLGEFGEVYVLDWGIAIALQPDPGGRLPTLGPTRSVAGTPAYMAPETLQGRADERTDVYLLGAILFEILAGRPPHQGDTVSEMLDQIRNTLPVLPADAPKELAAACMSALAVDPDERPGTAEAFAHGIRDFLQHRAAATLAAKAQQRFEELERHLDSERPDRQIAHRLFTEARFGFRHALREWPSHAAAAASLSWATERMIRFELQHGHARSAEMLLQELDPIPDKLAGEVRHAVESSLQQRAIADAALRDQDPAVGVRSRRIVAATVGTVFTILPLALPRLGGASMLEASHSTNIAFAVVFAIFLGLYGALQPERAFSTSLNRNSFGLLLLTPVAQVALNVAGLILGISAPHCVLLQLLLWSLLSWVGALLLDVRFAVSATTYFFMFFAAAADPTNGYDYMAVGNGAFTASVVWVWGRLEDGG